MYRRTGGGRRAGGHADLGHHVGLTPECLLLCAPEAGGALAGMPRPPCRAHAKCLLVCAGAPEAGGALAGMPTSATT